MNPPWPPPRADRSIGPASPTPARPPQRRLTRPWLPILFGLSALALTSLTASTMVLRGTRRADRMTGTAAPADTTGRIANSATTSPKPPQSTQLKPELPTAETTGSPTMPTSFGGTEPVPTVVDPGVDSWPTTPAAPPPNDNDTSAVPTTTTAAASPPATSPPPTTPSSPDTTSTEPTAGAPEAAEPPVTTPQTPCVPERLPSGLFDPNQAAVRAEYASELEALATRLASTTGRIDIHGHTDKRETMAYGGNQQLSEARAEAVKQYLVLQGIPEARITSQGFGADQPVETGDDPASLAPNRRVEVTVDCGT